MIREVIVLGGGTAGFLSALTLRIKLPHLRIRIVRSREIGIIGVGEGSTSDLPYHLHGFLGLDQARFYREARPTWKLGVRFEWGPRSHFNYTFTAQISSHLEGVRKTHGFHMWDDFEDCDLNSSLMSRGKVFARDARGLPEIRRNYAYHIENAWMVEYFERLAVEHGVEIVDATVSQVERGGEGVAALILNTGERISADLYIDASGFRSELLGKALEEPFESYDDALFCDRAVAGGWERKDEPILPYTVAETMDSGWAWQIEHEEHINRGYVYSSAFISDEDAEQEFRRKNPNVKNTRIVNFRTGRYRRAWVGNVFAVGNAHGFVEPLEATAIFVICQSVRFLAGALDENDCEVSPSMRESCDRILRNLWDEIRDFLAIHYRFNTRLETPFWNACRNDVALHSAESIVQHYRENGPAMFAQLDVLPPSLSIFQLDGFYTLLLGQKVPHERLHTPTPLELAKFNAHRLANAVGGKNGLSIAEALQFIRHPQWKWTPGFFGK
jgi:tryptophan 7-halogenase